MDPSSSARSPSPTPGSAPGTPRSQGVSTPRRSPSGMSRFLQLFKKADRFSVAHVQQLDEKLQQALYAAPPDATPEQASAAFLAHKETTIEAMRDLAEVLVWGDQHGASFFEYFLEAQMLQTLLNFLQLGDREITVQLVQTLSILIENLSETKFLYYLLSNNHINDLIEQGFDPQSAHDESYATKSDAIRDSDLVACYVSFLKTLSLRLDSQTINFFFNEQKHTFPLYTQALKLFNHRESMVRISVRVLTLNIFKVDVPAVRDYVINETAPAYFRDLCSLFARQCLRLGALSKTINPSHRRLLDSMVAEISDNLFYMQDVFDVGVDELSSLLCQRLLHTFILPVVFGSLVPDSHCDERNERIPCRVALFLLAHIFNTIRFPPLLNIITELLFFDHPLVPLQSLCPRVFSGVPPSSTNLKMFILHSAAGEDPIAFTNYMFMNAFITNSNIDKHLLVECGFASKVLSESVDEKPVDSDDKKIEYSWQKSLKPFLFNPNANPDQQGLCEQQENLFKDSVFAEETETEEGKTPEINDSEKKKEDKTEEGKEKEDQTKQESEAEKPVGTNADGTTTTEKEKQAKEDEKDADQPYLVRFVNRLMTTLQNAPGYRVITERMGLILLKQIPQFKVLEGAKAFEMNEEVIRQFDLAYDNSVDMMKRDLAGPLGEIFLEMFEDAVASCRKIIYFENIMNDGMNLWPPTSSPESRLKLMYRLPSGEAELMQKAILVFLTLRRYYLELHGMKETLIPLKEMPMPDISPKSVFKFSQLTSYARYQTPQTPNQSNSKLVLKFFAVVDAALLILTVSQREATEAFRKRTYPNSGTVEMVVPLERIDVEARGNFIQVTCHQLRWSTRMFFDSRTPLLEAHHLLDAGRNRARQFKMRQIYSGIGVTDILLSLPPRPCDFPDDMENLPPPRQSTEATPTRSQSLFIRRFSLTRTSSAQSLKLSPKEKDEIVKEGKEDGKPETDNKDGKDPSNETQSETDRVSTSNSTEQ